jgi:uncharacterized protein (TIGR02996 family)
MVEDALASWRKRRAPRLADVVDWETAKAPAKPLSPRTKHDEWLAAVRAGQLASALPLLTKNIEPPPRHYWEQGTSARRYAMWLERIALLASLKDDPRIVTAIVDAIVKAPWAMTWPEDPIAIVQPAMDLLVRIGDARAIPRLRALLEKPIAKRQTMREYLARVLPGVIKKLEEREAELDITEHARIDKQIGPVIVAALKDATGDEVELYAQVCAEADDDAPRAVLADHWLERDNPRGRFVSLQLQRTGEQEQRALLKAHEEEWIGDLVRTTKNRVYERGFLHAFALKQNAAADSTGWNAAMHHEALKTVRKIEKDTGNLDFYTDFVLRCPNLAEIDILSVGMLGKLQLKAERPFRARRISLPLLDPKVAAAAAASPLFASVKEVVFSVDGGKVKKLIANARAFAGRTIIAEPGRRMDKLDELTPFLVEVPNAGVEYGWRNRMRMVGRRAELECAHLLFFEDLLPALAKQGALDEVVLRLPASEMEPHPDGDGKLLKRLKGVKISPDSRWAKVL